MGGVVVNVLGDVIRFGPFRLAPDDYSLTRVLADGSVTEVPLRPKAFDLLRYMVENAGRLIPPEEFFDRLWPNIHVQADGLKGHMLHVRTALGDDPSRPTFIETIRGRGYRFIAPVQLPQAAGDRDSDWHRSTGSLLVGRSAPRRELDMMLRRALAGEAGVGFVTGEPGIGKTSLSNDFVNAAANAGALTVTSRCLPGGAASDAYYPVLDVLTQLARSEVVKDFVGLLSSIAPTWLIQLPWLMPATMAGGTHQAVFGTTQHRMIRELCDLLDMLSRDRLLLLLIEDIHWADQATLDLINAVAARRLQSRLLVLATMRGSGDHASARSARTLCQTLSLYRLGREVSLKPLTVDDVAEYLFGVSGFAPPHRLAVLLHERSEGNPLFMTAMLDHFVQEGLLVIGEDGWIVSDGMAEAAMRAPPSLARIVESEIDKLDPDTQAVLEAGSINEGEFSAAENHVATALDEERFEALCEHLVRNTALVRRADFAVLPAGRKVQRYAFRHMIFREVAYDRQSATRRAASHLAIGTGLEEIYANDLSAGASSLARNFLAAEQWGKAIAYLRLVARNAQTRFSTREAAATLEQALALTINQPADKRLDTEVQLLEDLARIYAGSLDARAGKTYIRLAQTAVRADRLDVECRALLGLGFTFAWTDIDRSMAVLSEAVEKSAGLEDRVARARIRSFGHGWRSWASGWNEEDAKACEAAIEIIRAEGDPVTLNASYVDHSLIVFTSSRYQESYDLISSCFDFLVKAREQHSDISLPLWIWRLGRPWSLLYAGSFGEALKLFQAGVASFLDNGDVGRAATLQFYQGFCHFHLQDHAGALALCDRALNFCDAHGTVGITPNEEQIEMVVRGLAELGAGRSDVAIDRLTAAGEVMRRRRTLTTWHWEMAREWGMADACLAAGLLEEARRHAGLFHDLAYAIRERTWRALASETAARIALRRDDLPAVADRLREAWQETEAGALPLVAWRLHAVGTRLHERRGDEEGMRASRRAWQDALVELAATLPEGHIGRQTLDGAEPIFG